VAAITIIGQMCAFLIGMTGIAGGVFLLFNNKSISGFGVFFTSLAGLLALFFYGRDREKPLPQKTPNPKP
jgi:hypothetical protein